ncbi:MAG: efflux RND transporter periplasmic adaptor subunit [Rhodanobacter sp.]|nr:MAG: efflux RND transporter periplasmic adaptor subunit [Rhodanobacter sp.]TAM12136.1 MAG: efflux RND transporter periplasmic adaptor subunit [Rhodanobacter sp.]TAM34607.1 MAG: efflux RND transporter periplasmic adaptor subunit [Rhodanobacter sp.]
MPLLVATAAAMLAACSSSPAPTAAGDTTPHDVTLTSAQQQSIRLYTVEPSTYRTVTDTTGTVDYDHDHSTAVLAPFSGAVVKVLVALGDHVQAGQPLATVASPDYAAAAETYRKTLAAAHAAAQLAATDKDLFAHDAISQRENTQAQSDAIGAASDRDAARATLIAMHVPPAVLARIERGDAAAGDQGIIRAPLAGTVVERSVTPGQLLSAGSTPCFTLADVAKAWVMAQVYGRDLARVKAGDRARVTVDGKTLDGIVANVSPGLDPDTRAAVARVVVDNAAGLLKRHMYVQVQLVSAQAQRGLQVPVGAVLRDDENLPFVYLRNADGGYARRPVTLGERDGDRYLIADGLHSGDQVVAEGGIFVRFIQTQ